MASANAAPERLTRQACDRCRRLKLRCNREHDTKICNRCQRKGSTCEYSASLPKGRRLRAAAVQPLPLNGVGNTQQELQQIGNVPCSNNGTAQTSLLYGANIELSDLPELDVRGEAEASTHGFYDLFLTSNSELGEDTIDYPEFFPDLDCHMTQVTPELHELQCLQGLGGGGGGGAGSSCCTTEEMDWEPLISQLAQFSASVSQLRYAFRIALRGYTADRSTTPGINQAEDCSLGEAVLRSVTLWLANGPADEMRPSPHSAPRRLTDLDMHHQTLGELLYRLFSASHYSTEIVQNLAPERAAEQNTPTARNRQSSFLDMAMPSLHTGYSPSSGSESNWLSSPTAQSQTPSISTNSIVLHLLVANHGMLLGIYSDIISLLHREIAVNSPTATLSLLKIRLGTFLRLCSCLVDRQHQSVNSQTALPTSSPLSLGSTRDALSDRNIKPMFNEIKHEIMLLQLRIDA